MRTPSENGTRPGRRRLADLEMETRELERKLSEARATLNRELSHLAYEGEPAPDGFHTEGLWADPDLSGGYDPGATGGTGYASGEDGYLTGEADYATDEAGEDGRWPGPAGGSWTSAAERTEALVTRGRQDAYRRKFPAARLAAAAVAVAAVTAVIVGVALPGGSASWPASVATVQREVARACQNPDVRAEPSQVNFACAKSTRQILWVFALMTSRNDEHFRDQRTGRSGLEPITAAQGGQVAWSLNLHHPYNAANPIDSIEVAARAINNIIGGASFTGPHGSPVVQPGLEGHSRKCALYTGSGAVIAQAGFPSLCARPVTVAGEAALVADVFQRWIVGATPQAAHAAAVLFAHAKDPGNAQVQSILKQVMRGRWLA